MRLKSRRRLVSVLLAGSGTLFVGPCGITTLQLQDFVTSALIRAGVQAAASVVEAAVVEGAQTSGDEGSAP